MSLQLSEISPDEVKRLAAEFESASLTDVLGWIWNKFGTRAAVGTSFQGAGLVMIDHAIKAGFRFPIFTLDTNLLFPETYELKSRLEKHWGIEIEAIQPAQTVEEQAAEYGAELWNKAPDVCCTLRKVVPLQKKLSTLAVWITGLRRQQSDTRERTQIVELYHFDVLRDLYILKANPMATWSREAVWDYIKANGIPYNALHDRGYRSIGCWPCTRPTGDSSGGAVGGGGGSGDGGDNERAGRWTGFDKSECGIHTFLGESI